MTQSRNGAVAGCFHTNKKVQLARLSALSGVLKASEFSKNGTDHQPGLFQRFPSKWIIVESVRGLMFPPGSSYMLGKMSSSAARWSN